ncbi:MAG: porin, partial [Planctomycetes bacterium]|nr:porin [Planctomycetota bacterium]
LVRPINTGGCGWDIGGRVDMLYGTDWRFGVNHGLEDRIQDFDGQYYGMVIPQAYLEIGYNDLSVKLGHFAAILDYEMIPAPPNPFYSHSYSYGYTVPQLVTGAMVDWKVTDRINLYGAFHRGWMMFEDFDNDLAVMAGIKWTSSDNKTVLTYALSSGRESFRPALPVEDDNRFVYSLVAQRQVTERLRYVLVHNLGFEKTSFTGQDAEWYGLNQYLLYKINNCLSANMRIEWMRDDDGVRIAGPGNIPGDPAWNGVGYAGNFYELTAGLNWRPQANLLFRPEIRYDWYDGLDSPIPGRPLQPFDAGNSDHQLTLAVDMVITY